MRLTAEGDNWRGSGVSRGEIPHIIDGFSDRKWNKFRYKVDLKIVDNSIYFIFEAFSLVSL